MIHIYIAIAIAPRPLLTPTSEIPRRPLILEQAPHTLANNTRPIITPLNKGYGNITAFHDDSEADIEYVFSCTKDQFRELADEDHVTGQTLRTALENIYDNFEGLVEELARGRTSTLWAPRRGPKWVLNLLVTLLAPFDCQFYLVPEQRKHTKFIIWTDFQGARLPHYSERAIAVRRAMS